MQQLEFNSTTLQISTVQLHLAASGPGMVSQAQVSYFGLGSHMASLHMIKIPEGKLIWSKLTGLIRVPLLSHSLTLQVSTDRSTVSPLAAGEVPAL